MVDEVNDLARLTPMVEQAEEVTGIRVPTTLADAGYFGGRHLEECARRGQQVVMPDPKQRSMKQDPYHKDRFTYDEDNDCYYCPRGQTLPFLRNSRKRGEPVRIYRASRLVCKSVRSVQPSESVPRIPARDAPWNWGLTMQYRADIVPGWRRKKPRGCTS